MGLARDLSMGPKRKRKPAPGTTGDYARLARLTKDENPDLEEFRAVLDRVAAQGRRFHWREGHVYNDACARYIELTGEPYGSPTQKY